MNLSKDDNTLYTPELIGFAQLGVKLASLLEQGADKIEYVQQLLVLLPRLYSQMLTLPSYFYDPNEDLIEEYITEQSYDKVRLKAEEILSEDDLYLTATSNDIQYSETPLARHISEDLADIYQHIGNLLGIIKARNEYALPAAIGRCYLYYREHWGLALISALGALHQLYAKQEIDYNDIDAEQDDDFASYDDIDNDEYQS